MKGKCGYAHAGTYGHECGNPAKWAQELPDPEGWTRYWSLRCDECRNATGGDNARLDRDGWIPYVPDTLTHEYLRNQWPRDPIPVTVPA